MDRKHLQKTCTESAQCLVQKAITAVSKVNSTLCCHRHKSREIKYLGGTLLLNFLFYFKFLLRANNVQSPVQQNPYVEVGANYPLRLAINTAQFGRTFQVKEV